MLRGEIYTVDLDPVVGREAGGVRPVVVVSNDVVNERPVFVAIVPAADAAGYSEKAGVFVTAEASGHATDLVVFPTQVRTLDPCRFPTHASGTVPAALMDRIAHALKVFLDIG